MKKLCLLILLTLSLSKGFSQKDSTRKAPQVEFKQPIDTAFTQYMDAVYEAFASQLSQRLSTTQWKAVLGELNQTIYDVTMKDLNALMANAIIEWNKRKQPPKK